MQERTAIRRMWRPLRKAVKLLNGIHDTQRHFYGAGGLMLQTYLDNFRDEWDFYTSKLFGGNVVAAWTFILQTRSVTFFKGATPKTQQAPRTPEQRLLLSASEASWWAQLAMKLVVITDLSLPGPQPQSLKELGLNSASGRGHRQRRFTAGLTRTDSKDEMTHQQRTFSVLNWGDKA